MRVPPAWVLIPLLLGLLVRGAFLVLAYDIEPHADEARYLNLAVQWLRFGFYSDSGSFFWPPGYPVFLGVCLKIFGGQGILAAKVVQVLLSMAIGGSVLALADRAFGRRAAWVAGTLWAVYLPLVGFTHYLWTETVFLAVFLPTLCLFLRTLARFPAGAGWGGLAACGLLLGVCLLIKDSTLPLLCLAPVGLLLFRRSDPFSLRLLRALILPTAALVVTAPWALRNQNVYGRWVLSGATLGYNMFRFVNADYRNQDLPDLDPEAVYEADDLRYRWLILGPETDGWQLSKAPNVVDRNSENVRSALSFISQRPGYFLRSSIKKLADWLTPISFFIRHQGLGLYPPPLSDPPLRGLTIWTCLLSTLLVLTMAVPGFLVVPGDRLTRTVLAVGVLGFLCLFPVGGMSRFRLPVEPLLIVMASGFMVQPGCLLRAGRARLTCTLATWALLGLLWWCIASEVEWFLRDVL